MKTNRITYQNCLERGFQLLQTTRNSSRQKLHLAQNPLHRFLSHNTRIGQKKRCCRLQEYFHSRNLQIHSWNRRFVHPHSKGREPHQIQVAVLVRLQLQDDVNFLFGYELNKSNYQLIYLSFFFTLCNWD